jgi:hypothetical protein
MENGYMSDEQTDAVITYEVRVSAGRDGSDPEAPDWEVCEMENGVVRNNADIFDNLTLTEASDMAAMWTKKKEDAGF